MIAKKTRARLTLKKMSGGKLFKKTKKNFNSKHANSKENPPAIAAIDTTPSESFGRRKGTCGGIA
jgi:hypothetical protein